MLYLLVINNFFYTLYFMQKKIKLIKNLSINFYFLNNNKFIVLNKDIKSFYLRIPNNIVCTKEENFILLTLINDFNTKNIIIFQNFILLFFNWLKNFEKPLVKKLILKGLGLKAIVSKNNILELKLGFSHTINVSIPEQLIVSIKKNVINIEGYDPILLGNFLHKVRILKYPNIYKGKGIWYKNELKTLKVVKKI